MKNPLDNAKWIWHNDYHVQNVYLNFYETLNALPGKTYQMYISCDSNYAVYINGAFVQSGQYADYPEYKVYDVLDITSALREGSNEITILGYYQGKDFSTYRQESAGMLYAVVQDGKTVLVSSENTRVGLNRCFKSQGVPTVSGQLGFSWDYDSTKENRQQDIKNADVQDKKTVLYPRPVKKLEIGDRLPSHIVAWGEIKDNGQDENIGVRMQTAYMAFRYNGKGKMLPDGDGVTLTAEAKDSEGIYLVIDLGSETVGYTDISIEVPQDCEILIGHGEHLEDLRVRAYINGRTFTARYFATAGLNEFFNPMRRMGLRYMQLNIYSKSAKIHYAGIRPTSYPLNHAPYFGCSDHLHNRIYQVCVRTLENCMHDHYEDCPWREQALYAMDSRNQMLCGYYAFGEYDFPKASLRLIAKSIREDNMLELCSPARVSITIPSFCAIFLKQVYEYIIYSGDVDFGKEIFDVLKRVADAFAARIGDRGLIEAFCEKKYWNFYEWQIDLSGAYGVDDLDKLTCDAPLNAFVSMGWEALSKVCSILGRQDEAEKYMALHENLNLAIDREFWDGQNNVYYTYVNVKTGQRFHLSQLTQALVVCCGACNDDKLDAVLQNMMSGKLYDATLSHRIFVFDALMKRPEKYARVVMCDIAEKWGKMLYNGATTFWETIEGASDFENAGSLCHGWSAVPLYVYFRYAAGFVPCDDGSAKFKIQPLDCGLYECEAMTETARGTVKTPDCAH